MKRLLVVAAASVVLLAIPGTAKADAPWQCESGHCQWGYNYIGPDLNSWVPGPWNYWLNGQVLKNSGGIISVGMYSQSAGQWCLNNLGPGGSVWYFITSDIGCGGYNRPAIGYFSGATSYARMDVYS